ncbi:MAG: hypothetical protein IH571_05775, partial [Acholeplasmataceae bacterium]|nr:hypothetical protein [Acholeplasmataceae bacterium]
MRLSDVLKLPKEPHSLSIIKDFLEQSLSQIDYQAAFNHYFEIACTLGLFDMVYHEGEKVLKEISMHAPTDYSEKILKSLILSAISMEKFEEAKAYIERRKQLLPVLKQYLGILDEIEYKKALGLPYLEDVQKVLRDVIPDQVRIFCFEETYQIYKKTKNHEMALESLYELYNFDLKHKYQNDELSLLCHLGRFDEAKEKALDSLRQHTSSIEAVITLLKVYLNNKDFHKAMTLEADYEELIDSQSDEYKKMAYELIVDLYKKMNNKLSFDVYNKKLKSLQKTLEKKGKTFEEKPPQEIVFIETPQEKQLSHKKIYEHLAVASDLIIFSHLIDEKLLLRDYLRMFFMHAETNIHAKEFLVYLDKATPNLFHYKKERLYDKTITNHFFEQTVIEYVFKSGEEFFQETKTMRWQKNIITQKAYEDDVKFVYTLPLGDAGVLSVHFEEEIKDPGLHYDLIKLMGSILFTHVLDEKKTNRFKQENRYYRQALNSPILAYRELSEHKSTYNDAAQVLFHVDEHHHLELFLRDVSYAHIHIYKETIAKLLSKPGETRSLLYKYQEKHILEKLYAIKT